jgi:transglutaminase-like putative cysteine protease
MLLHTLHRTRYAYPSPVIESHNALRLAPLSDDDQRLLDFRLSVSPPARLFSYTQPGGTVHHFNVRAPHSELEIVAESRVETRRANPFESLNLAEDDWEFYERYGVRQDYAEFLAPTRLVSLHAEADRIAQVAQRKAGAGAASFLIALTRLLHRLLTYEPGATHVHTALDDFLEDRRGVCQDFAHLMLAVCRSRNIPARYLSGYVYSPSDAPSTHAEQATHAWVECLLPGGFWRGFDPTNNLLANERYVKVHWGRDYADVPPTRGVYRGASDNSISVEVAVTQEQ